MIQAMKSLVSLRDLGRSLKGIMLSIWMVWLSSTLSLRRQQSQKRRKARTEKTTKTQRRMVQRLTRLLPCSLRLSCHTRSIAISAGTTYSWLASQICPFMLFSGVIRYFEYTSYPLLSLLPTSAWHWVRLPGGRASTVQRLLKQTVLQMLATSGRWKLRMLQLKPSRLLSVITPLWSSCRAAASAERSVLPAEMLWSCICRVRQRVLSTVMACEVCLHCGSRKSQSVLKLLAMTRRSTEKEAAQASSQRTLREERLTLLRSVSFLFLEMRDFLALICSSISSSSLLPFLLEYSSQLSSSSSREMPRCVSSLTVANSLRYLSQWLPRCATQGTGMSRNQIMMSQRFLSMSTPMYTQQPIMAAASSRTQPATTSGTLRSTPTCSGQFRKAGQMAPMQLRKMEAISSALPPAWKQLSSREFSRITASFRFLLTVKLFSSCSSTATGESMVTAWALLRAQRAEQLAEGSMAAMMLLVSREYSWARRDTCLRKACTLRTWALWKQRARAWRAKRRRRKRQEARRRLATSAWLRLVLMAARSLAWQPSSSNLNSSRSSSPALPAPPSRYSFSPPSAQTILISLLSSRMVLIFSVSSKRPPSSSSCLVSARLERKMSMTLGLSQSSRTPPSSWLSLRSPEAEESSDSSSRWARSFLARVTLKPSCFSLSTTMRSSSSSPSPPSPNTRTPTPSTCTTHSPARPPSRTPATAPLCRRKAAAVKCSRPRSAMVRGSVPRAVCARRLLSVTRPRGSVRRSIFMLLEEASLKTTCHSPSSGRCTAEQSTGMRWLNLWLRKPSRSRSSSPPSSRQLAPSRANSCGATRARSRSSSSSRWQPVTSVNMRLALAMRGRALGAARVRMSTGAVILFSDCSSKCSSSTLRCPDWRSWQILRAVASSSRPSAQSSLTRMRQWPQLQSTSQAAPLMRDSSPQFSAMPLPASVIWAPTRLSFLRSGTSSLSSVQNSLWSLAERSMASSRRETQFSKRMVSMRSASLPSRLSRFSRMIFLKRQMLNCCWKEGSRRAALTNSSQAFSLQRRCSSWKKPQLMRSLVHSGNFLTPARNMRSSCLSTCWQLCSMLSSPLRLRRSSLSGQSGSLQTSLCFSMQPMSIMQLFLSLPWLPTSCSTEVMCPSSCSPLLNFRLLTNSVFTSEGLSKQMITAKKGSPLIQMTSAPSKPYPPSTCPTNSISAVQKQQVEQILKNLVAALEQKGCLTEQHQNCQKERRNMAVTQKALPSTGLKMNRNSRMILFRMNTTSPFEFCRAVSLPAVMRGSKRARATTEEMTTKTATKRRVRVAWKRCQPVQHSTSGKLVMVHPSLPRSHSTTLSSTSVIGRKSTVTKSGTTCASTTRGKVKRNFFFEKEQLTQTMSRMISRMMKMSPQSTTRKALKGAPGRQDPMLNFLKKRASPCRLSPPYQASITRALKGKARICRQSSPDSSARRTSDSSSSSSDFLSRITKSTLKIESLKSAHACSSVFFSYSPISAFIFEDYSIAFKLQTTISPEKHRAFIRIGYKGTGIWVQLFMNQFYKGDNNEFIEAAYAPSGRSTCRACKQKIAQESIRLSYNMETENHYSTYWYHLNCFELKPKFIDIDPMQEIYNIDQIDGNATDMDVVVDYIEAEKARLKSGGKRQKAAAAVGKKEEGKGEEKVQTAAGYTAQQQKQYEELVQEYSSYTADKLKQMLTINSQSKTGNKGELVEKCADGKVLGQIPMCPKCGGGRPKFDKSTATYKCPGYMDDDKYRHCNKSFAMGEIERAKWVDL